jgi:hypothetical protein
MKATPRPGRSAGIPQMVLLTLLFAGLACGPTEVHAQGNTTDNTPPTVYRLNADSRLQDGCFPPCLCPILLDNGMRGTFLLMPTGFDGFYKTYAVSDVNWLATIGDKEVRITGSGTFTVSDEFAMQQLSLDLRVGDRSIEHFDSGLVPGGEFFPDIKVAVSIHGQQCFDTVLRVDASPVPPDQIHPYALLPESTFQRGCFPPCRCALGPPQPMSGTVALVDLEQGPLFAEFAVVNVDWLVASTPGATGTTVRGTGMYRVGGEFAVQQQLSLDLTVDNEDLARFDSGLVAGGGDFPGSIDVGISLHGGYCFDTVMDLHARPLNEAATRLAPGTGNFSGPASISSRSASAYASLLGGSCTTAEPSDPMSSSLPEGR